MNAANGLKTTKNNIVKKKEETHMEKKRINYSAQTLHKQVNYLKTFFPHKYFPVGSKLRSRGQPYKKTKKQKKEAKKKRPFAQHLCALKIVIMGIIKAY